MNRLISVCLSLVVMAETTGYGQAGEKISVGFYKDRRSAPMEVFQKHLGDEFRLEVIEAKDLKPEILNKYDILFFTGGWNAYGWANDAETRYQISRFVAGGGGVLLSSFRTGGVRNDARTMFPEIGYGGVRLSERLVKIKDKNHPIAKDVPGQFLNGYGEQIMLHPGAEGKVIAVNSGEAPVLIAGEYHNGRVVLYGSYIHDLYSSGISPHGTDAILPEEGILLKNILRWLAAKGARKEAGENFELSFWQREKILDEMNENSRISNRTGILSEVYWDILEPLDRYGDQSAYYYQIIPQPEINKFADKVKKLKVTLNEKKAQLFQDREKYLKKAGLSALKSPALSEGYCAEFKKNLSAIVDASGINGAWEAMDKQYRPLVLKERREKQKEQLKADKGKIPSVLEILKDENPQKRKEAVLELGRIADKKSAKNLLGLLNDPDNGVRTAVIQALGWMRSEEAVPELLKLCQDKEPRIRRRAAQSLGITGDIRAYDTLVKLLDDPDHYTRENAVYSLGWLRDKRAKPLLMAHYEKAGQKEYRGMKESAAVICALSDIGERDSLPFLKQIQGNCQALQTMFPIEEGNYRDYYWQGGSLPEFACLAVRAIEKGKKSEAGIAQPEFQSLRENFYWFSHYYRPVTGRYFCYSTRPKNAIYYPSYLKSLGATAEIADAVRLSPERFFGRTYDDILDEFDLLDVKLIHNGPRHASYWSKAGTLESLKTDGQHECFLGYWNEEVIWPGTLQATNAYNAKWYPPAWLEGRIDRKGFRRHLEQKYESAFLKKEGIADEFWATFSIPRETEEMVKTRKEKTFIWAELVEYQADILLENWAEWQLWLSGIRKGTVTTWSSSETLKQGGSNYIKIYPNLCKIFAAFGPQSYNEHSYKNVFQVELAQDGERNTVLPEIYGMYSPNPEYVKRGIATSFLHGGAFFEWYVQHVQRYGGSWTWEKGRWEVTKEMFDKGNKLSEYLMPVSQPRETALLFSGRTSDLLYGRENPGGFGGGKCGGRYFQNQEGLWEAFTQAHLPVAVIWAETLTGEKLAPYQALVLSNARSLRKEETEIIRNWVKEGGILIASGSSSLCDDWAREQQNYVLSDVFGVERISSARPYCYDPEHTLPVELQIKPDKGLGKVAATNFPAGEAEFYTGLGYEKIKTATATVLARYENGDIALTRNSYGKGHCFYLSMEYPGLSYTPWKYSGESIRKTYWPGVTDFLRTLVTESLKAKGKEPLLVTEGCPEYVEVGVRCQDEKNRWMVHALNYDPDVKETVPFKVSVLPPSTEGLKVYCPYTGKRIDYETRDGRVEFEFCNLGDHQLVVLSWQEE